MDQHLKQDAGLCLQLPQLTSKSLLRVTQYHWSIDLPVQQIIIFPIFRTRIGLIYHEENYQCHQINAVQVFQ